MRGIDFGIPVEPEECMMTQGFKLSASLSNCRSKYDVVGVSYSCLEGTGWMANVNRFRASSTFCLSLAVSPQSNWRQSFSFKRLAMATGANLGDKVRIVWPSRDMAKNVTTKSSVEGANNPTLCFSSDYNDECTLAIGAFN